MTHVASVQAEGAMRRQTARPAKVRGERALSECVCRGTRWHIEYRVPRARVSGECVSACRVVAGILRRARRCAVAVARGASSVKGQSDQSMTNEQA